MRKNKHSQSFVPEYSAKSVHCRLKLRYVHEHIVRDDDIKLRVAHGSKFNAGINPKIDTRMIGSGDFDHAVRKINSRNQGAPIAGLFRQITGTAAGVEHLATTHVAGKCPQHRVGIENAIAVSLKAHLDVPVIGDTVPEISDLVFVAFVHSLSLKDIG